jgi:hypothetical protein
MKKSVVKSLAVFLILIALTFSTIGSTPAHAATTWVVTSLADDGSDITGACPDATACRLRRAVALASDGDTITFASSLSGQAIYLAADLTLSKNLTIDGSSLASQISISGDTGNNGGADVRVFTINSGITANLNNLIITKGKSPAFGGGGILNYGTLTVNNSTISASSGTGNGGGGILNWGGMLIVTNSSIINNPVGGGIISYNAIATISNSTISGNSTTTYASGGGIWNYGAMTITDSTISNNVATSASGGGIYNNSGVLIIDSSVIATNTAGNPGGGIYNLGTLTVSDTTFSGNSGTRGGGLYSGASGTMTVKNSTFSNNIATLEGGGVYSQSGNASIIANNTFFGNSASSNGGGVYIGNTLSIVNSTFSNNSASSGGGLYNTSILNYANNIVANSTSGGDCVQVIGSIGTNKNNLVEDASCSASLSGDPNLGSLADNGGPTQTIALITGSPAIDAGDTATCSAAPVNNLDQRGVTRPQGAQCDVGAYEGSITSGTTFVDVPTTHPLYKYIEALYDAGYTAGCSSSPMMFCPDTILDRAQSAVFMLRGQMGSGYTPPAVTGIFGDNWTGFEWAQPWAEGMYQEGLTTGCQSSPLLFCPANQLPRVEASIFGLRMKYGVGYTPPAASGTLFADFPPSDPSYWGIDWAEQAYLDGLLPACGTDSGTGKPMFCPSQLVDRGWGAYLIVKAKNLPTP